MRRRVAPVENPAAATPRGFASWAVPRRVEGEGMPHYSLHFLQPDNSVTSTTDFDCDSDEEALEKVARIFYLHPLELWQGGRLVRRIDRSTRSADR
jgi:hypothetical protein